MIVIDNVQFYWGMIIQGVITGFSVAIGSYLANNHLIKKAGRIKKRIMKVLR